MTTAACKNSVTSTGCYVRLSLTETGSQNVQVAAIGFGADGNHDPNNANNAAAVAS